MIKNNTTTKKHAKKSISGIYAITDPNLLADNVLIDEVSQAIDAGISVLQYRNKIADYSIQQQQAEKLSHLCKKNNVCFIINDHIQLAKEVSADGVHLGKSDNKIKQARESLGQNAIIGISCYHQLNTALNAQKEGADYIAFGRFFPSQTKPLAIQAEIGLLTIAKQALSIPIVAIGGITCENIDSLLSAGADSIAVINSIFGQDNTFKSVKQLVKKYDHRKSR
jgi:thiamine-phosphate pyrophosphorylase